MTVLTLFDSDRARGADSSDAVRVACRACAALHDRRCSKARSALGPVRRRRTVFTARGVKRRRSQLAGARTSEEEIVPARRGGGRQVRSGHSGSTAEYSGVRLLSSAIER